MPPRHPTPQVVLERIASRLRLFRHRAHLTQEQLAERAQIQAETVSRLENGRQQPSVGMLWALSEALHVGVGDLMDETAAGDVVPDEQEILLRYRSLSEHSRQGMLEMLRGLEDSGPVP